MVERIKFGLTYADNDDRIEYVKAADYDAINAFYGERCQQFEMLEAAQRISIVQQADRIRRMEAALREIAGGASIYTLESARIHAREALATTERDSQP